LKNQSVGKKEMPNGLVSQWIIGTQSAISLLFSSKLVDSLVFVDLT